MNIVIIPMFNAAVSFNETVELVGSNFSATELKNKRPFSALKSVGVWKHICKSPGTFRNFTICATLFRLYQREDIGLRVRQVCGFKFPNLLTFHTSGFITQICSYVQAIEMDNKNN